MLGYRTRQIALAGLALNVVRPAPGWRTGVPSFFAGWLAGEMAPHLLALSTVDTALQLAGPGHRQRRPDRLALGLAGLTALELGWVTTQAWRARAIVDDALDDALGEGWRAAGGSEDDRALDTPLGQLVWPFRMRNAHVEVLKDIPYGPAGRRNALDVYRPRGGVEDAPVLLHVHGGAWKWGSKDAQGIPLMQHMAARGWACVSINYRLSPRSAFPAQIEDVKRAIAWIREHGRDYGMDPSYLAVTGGSAGGHLASLAALSPNDPAFQPGFEDADTRVDACVPHYGVYDIAAETGLRSAREIRDGFFGPQVADARYRDAPEVFEQASPYSRVCADACDFFVIHGTHDTVVSVRQARRFVARLREVSGGVTAYAELPGTQHAFDVFPSIRSAAVVRGIDRFLHWHRATHR